MKRIAALATTLGVLFPVLTFNAHGAEQPEKFRLQVKSIIPLDVYKSRKSISADGLSVAGSVDSEVHECESCRAYYWNKDTGMVFIGDLPGGRVEASVNSISRDGRVVGTSWSGNASAEAFQWSLGSEISNLGKFPENFIKSSALDISEDGSTIVGDLYTRSRGVEPYYWNRTEGYVPFGRLATGSSWAVDVSADGSVIVGYGYNEDSVQEAFLWTKEKGHILLGDLPGHGFLSKAYDVSGDGTTVVGYSSTRSDCGGLCNPHGVLNRAFRWTEDEGMVDLGFLSGGNDYSVAYSVSHDGSIIIGSSGSASKFFIWTKSEGIQDFGKFMDSRVSFNRTDWNLKPLRLIDNHGVTTLVGVGRYLDEDPVLWHIELKRPDLEVIPPESIEVAVVEDEATSGCKPVKITNNKQSEIIWKAKPNQAWLTLPKSEGSLVPQGTDEVSICWNAEGLANNRKHQGEIVFLSPDDIQIQKHFINLSVSTSLPYTQEFDLDLPLPMEWEVFSSLDGGRVEIVDGRLKMDADTEREYNLNEAVLSLNLSGLSSLILEFFQSEEGDEEDSMSEVFTRHANADGVAISNDGKTWYRILDASDLDVQQAGKTFVIDLDEKVNHIRENHDPGFGYTNPFKIKFQQYDNFATPVDGRYWDNIKVSKNK